MKISCTQENLIQGLMIVSHIASKNANLPILSNILIKAEDKILNLSATNLEIGVSTQIRGKVEEDGEFTVNAKLLTDYISLLPKDRVDIFMDENAIKIQCQKQKTKINTQAASEFPVIPKIKKENPYIIKAQELKEGILKVMFAVSNSETRPEISGVCLGFKDGVLVMASTDSYRLAEEKIKITEGPAEEKRIIVPVKTLQEISRILGVFREETALENVENMEIYLTENQIMFSYNGADLVSRLIEGQYPDYLPIIPTEHKTKIKVGVSELVNAVKTASLFTKSGIFDIKLEINPESKEITITSSSSQTGESISNLEAEIEGEVNSIVLNYRYFLDGLQNLSAEKAIMEIGDNNKPCLLKADGKDDYLYIIMPIRQ